MYLLRPFYEIFKNFAYKTGEQLFEQYEKVDMFFDQYLNPYYKDSSEVAFFNDVKFRFSQKINNKLFFSKYIAYIVSDPLLYKEADFKAKRIENSPEEYSDNMSVYNYFRVFIPREHVFNYLVITPLE